MLLRLDPAVHDALARWAADELRSTNAQIEFLLRRALADAGRLPGHTRPDARPGPAPRHPGRRGGRAAAELADARHDAVATRRCGPAAGSLSSL